MSALVASNYVIPLAANPRGERKKGKGGGSEDCKELGVVGDGRAGRRSL